MSFLPKFSNAFGLDISDRSIKVVQLYKEGKKISGFSYKTEEIPPGLIEDGEKKRSSPAANKN
jgi:Tfp pilus assembly PilM family ATPase